MMKEVSSKEIRGENDPLVMCRTLCGIAVLAKAHTIRELAVKEAFDAIFKKHSSFLKEFGISHEPPTESFIWLYLIYPGVGLTVEVFERPDLKKLIENCSCSKCTSGAKGNQFQRPRGGVFDLFVQFYDKVDDPSSEFFKHKTKQERRSAHLKALGIKE